VYLSVVDGLGNERREEIVIPIRDQLQAPEAAEERLEGAEPRSAAGGAQEGAERPWWRRVLGG
jgi:hypothetical protein